MVFDLHADTIWKIWKTNKALPERARLQNSFLQIDEQKLIKGGYTAQCFAMYVPADTPDPKRTLDELFDTFEREIASCETLAKVECFSDFEKNVKQDKISAVMTMEDACPIGEDIKNLAYCYEKGVRMVGLTWNFKNQVGYPNYKDFKRTGWTPNLFKPETEHGLTDFGKALVLEMNRLGMVVDVSHLSDKGFYDVISLSKKPIVASHSNARSICKNVRNLTDDMLKKLCDNGGVVGMNYAKGFLCEDEEKGKNTVEFVLKHVKYIKKKFGVDCIALGSDFDGIDADIQLSDASKLPSLVSALERAGLTADEIEKICYKNALRVFKENLQSCKKIVF